MTQPRRPRPASTDRRAGAGAWGPSPWYLVIAVGLVAGGLAAWWMAPATPTAVADAPLRSATSVAAASVATAPAAGRIAGAASPAASGPAARLAVASTAATPRIPRTRDPGGDQTPDIADFINEGEKPTMAEVIDRLHRAGVHSGLGAFSPPGTRPPLIGLAVPEDFVLPAGYVRHYQATDDGQRIEPILMFSPDYQFLDAAGHPIAIPENRVVPPELAPPGLPIRRIVVPAPTDPSIPGS